MSTKRKSKSVVIVQRLPNSSKVTTAVSIKTRRPFKVGDRVIWQEKQTRKPRLGTITHDFGNDSYNMNLDGHDFSTYKVWKVDLLHAKVTIA